MKQVRYPSNKEELSPYEAAASVQHPEKVMPLPLLVPDAHVPAEPKAMEQQHDCSHPTAESD